MKSILLLAAADGSEIVVPVPSGSIGHGYARDVFYIFGAAVLVLLVLMAWAMFFRKKKRERTSERITYKSGRLEESDEDSDSGDAGERRRRKRHRKMRRPHRGRNPTLSETGGLPPPRNARSEEPR